MRFALLPASLLAAFWLSVPADALAQAPEPAPPPAESPRTSPSRDYAVPRAQMPRSEPIAVGEPQSVTGASRRDTSNAEQGSRRRPPATATPAPSPAPSPTTSTASSTESRTESSDQGAQRPGAVRRPSADSSAGSGRGTRDRAVARSSAPPRDRDGNRVYIYPDYWSYGRYYDPYYSSGFHLGYLAYSPWGWMPAFYGYPYGGGYHGGYGYQARGYDLGSLKIKVTPRDAEVFVDGYFAGQVDDFDGFWQALKLDSGGYRIEIRKPGYETLQFDVHVQPDRTITYRGELRPTP